MTPEDKKLIVKGRISKINRFAGNIKSKIFFEESEKDLIEDLKELNSLINKEINSIEKLLKEE